MSEWLGFDGRVAVHPQPLNRDVVHFLLSRQSTTKSDLEAINTAIDTFLGAEAYCQLLARYGLDRELRFHSGPVPG